MLVIDNISSLNLVKEEIELTLEEATRLLDAYSQTQDDQQGLEETLSLFLQINGVLKLIGLKGAIILIGEIEYLLRGLIEGNQDKEDVERQLYAIGNSIIHLSQYMEYVQIRDRSVPMLLMSPINEMRKVTGRPPLFESSFVQIDFKLDCSIEAIGLDPSEATKDFNESRKRCRRFRHMYQVGMLGVYKGMDADLHMRLMDRAISGVMKVCGPVNISKLWWVAKGLIKALQESKQDVSPSRLLLLGKVDRELKQLVYGKPDSLNAEASQTLIKQIMCVVGLSPNQSALIKQLKHEFNVNFKFNEDEIEREFQIMNGPDGSVIMTVTKAILEELTQVKDQLDLVARGVGAVQSFTDVSSIMIRITQTLVMLGLVDAADVLRKQAEEVESWGARDGSLEAEEFSKIADSILFVENALFETQRVSKIANPLVSQDDDSDISLSQLEEARHMVVLESRAGLSVAKRAISSYVDSHCDDIHLENIPSSLVSISGGLGFLHLERAAEVLVHCSYYIKQQLIGAPDRPESYHLETLADAITSIDYYLESMELNKPIGDGVLEVAEESIAELGVAEVGVEEAVGS